MSISGSAASGGSGREFAVGSVTMKEWSSAGSTRSTRSTFRPGGSSGAPHATSANAAHVYVTNGRAHGRVHAVSASTKRSPTASKIADHPEKREEPGTIAPRPYATYQDKQDVER